MNDAHITIVGWVAADPFYKTTANGTPYLTLRIGCTPRRFDRQTGQWQDMETMLLTVNCWRGLADNVNASELRRGHPVIVTGRLRIREYIREGQFRFSAEIEAITLGHDLSRGTALFRPLRRGGGMTEDDRLEAREHADQWAQGGAAPDGEASDGEASDGEASDGEASDGEEDTDQEAGEEGAGEDELISLQS